MNINSSCTRKNNFGSFVFGRYATTIETLFALDFINIMYIVKQNLAVSKRLKKLLRLRPPSIITHLMKLLFI